MSVFKERWYQTEAVRSVFDYFDNGGVGNPIVAMPTGTGKSYVIAKFIEQVLKTYPGQRLMMLTHVSDLISQNADKLKDVWSLAPMGIYSAALNSRDMAQPIIYGGVQSVIKEIERSVEQNKSHFGHRDLIIIDECHLLSPNENSTYQKVIAELLKINPFLKVIGLTATPYRLKQGLLIEPGSIFTNICYDLTEFEKFNRLVAEGFLAPLITQRQNLQIDVSNVKIVNDDYDQRQVDALTNTDETVMKACDEACEKGYDRKSWLFFASSIENADKITDYLQYKGVDALAVHSKISKDDNAERIASWKAGKLRCVVSNNKMTTGVDNPALDLIVILRPTISPGLWVQMLGRGTRPCDGKLNCLVLDFVGNAKELGPINDPVLPRKAGKGGGDAPIRICPECLVYNHASARECCLCGLLFTFKNKIFESSKDDTVMRTNEETTEQFVVNKVTYNYHVKTGFGGKQASPPSMKVTYFCGEKRFREWVCFEHSGFAKKKATDWWMQRSADEAPCRIEDALKMTSSLRTPSSIFVETNTKFPEIKSIEW